MGTAHIYLALLTIVASLGLTGCGTLNSMAGGNSVTEAQSKIVLDYEKDSIVVLAQSDKTLNQVSGSSHSLSILVVQSDDMNQLVKLNEGEGAIVDMLAGNENSSVLAVNRFFIEPNCKSTYVVDRAEKAKYVGVFGGYFEKPKAGFGKFYEIGTQVIKSGKVVKTYKAQPEKLIVKIGFGADSITSSETLSADVKFEKKAVCVN